MGAVVIDQPEYTKEMLIPFKYRIIGPQKMRWLFGIQWQALPTLPTAKNNDGDPIPGRYDIIDCIQAIFQSRTNRREQSSVGQLEMARMRKLSVETERETIKNEMLRGTVVRIQDVDAEVLDMILAVRSKLLGYPSYVARLVLGKENYDEVVRIMTEVLEQILDDLRQVDLDAIRARNTKLTKLTDIVKDASAPAETEIEAAGMNGIDGENFRESGETPIKRGRGRPRKT